MEDLRYVVPSRVKVSVYNGDEEWASQSFPMAQFGRVEHLGADLFNKKMDTEIILDPTTGGISRITAPRPE